MTTSATAQPKKTRLAKKATSAIPRSNRLNPKNQIAMARAGVMPTTMRIRLMLTSAVTNSDGRSGVTIR